MISSEFEGKVVVVTGGAQGIGKCLVQSFGELGATVHFCDLNEEAGVQLHTLLSDLGYQVKFHLCDLGQESQVRTFAQTVGLAADEIHVLVNNVAATGFGHPFKARPFQEWNDMLAVGLTSFFLCSQLFAPALAKANGCIVNIASTRALMSEANSEPYSACKGGIVALTHSLAITLAPDRVRVNCISPGWIDVSAWKYPPAQDNLSEEAHRQHPVGRVGRPEDIAQACLFLASPTSAGFITGQNLVVDGGMVRKMIYEE